jgi:TrmH family RNA methyltransferase
MECVFYCPELIAEKQVEAILKSGKREKTRTQALSAKVFRKLSYRESTGGVICLFRTYKNQLSEFHFRNKHPLILVVDQVEKPGNLGAMCRTADAAAVDLIIVCDTSTDLFNPNVIRSSLGTVFTNKVVISGSELAASWLKQHKIPIFIADPTEGINYRQADFSHGAAVVMGAESTGISEFWRKQHDSSVRIPMYGKIDSMNVSVSAAIILFEARNQIKS